MPKRSDLSFKCELHPYHKIIIYNINYSVKQYYMHHLENLTGLISSHEGKTLRALV